MGDNQEVRDVDEGFDEAGKRCLHVNALILCITRHYPAGRADDQN